jgi:hypothetical protein
MPGKLRTLLLVLGAVSCLLNSGCLASRIMEHNEREDLARLNFEREKAGLRPLSYDEYHNGPRTTASPAANP